MQAEEAALLAVDMAAAERRIHSALNAHISELRQQIESEERAEVSEQIKLQVESLCQIFPGCRSKHTTCQAGYETSCQSDSSLL